MRFFSRTLALALCLTACATDARAQATGRVAGRVNDETGAALPGVTVQLRAESGEASETVTSGSGDYAFERLGAGRYQLSVDQLRFADAA